MKKVAVIYLITVVILTLVISTIVGTELANIQKTQASSENNLVENSIQNTDNLITEASIPEKKYSAGISKRREYIKENGEKVTGYLSSKGIKNSYGIYFIDLKNSNIVYAHNSDKHFYPASIYKVPLAMVTLKQIELGEFSLEDKVWHEGELKSIDKVIEVMIRESNNDSMGVLERKLGGYATAQKLIDEEFGVSHVIRRPQTAYAEELGKILSQLYPDSDKRYLNKEHTQYLIEHMFNPVSWLRDRIPAAVNNYNKKYGTQLTAATKIGTLNGVYQDAGIIFGKKSDYALVILNNNRLTTDATVEIDYITNTLLTNLE